MAGIHIPYPQKNYSTEQDVEELQNIFTDFINKFQWLIGNLDTQNVIEARSVKAQNIDVTQAQIKDAQIGSLKADKLWAGTIDSGKVSIKEKDSNKTIDITGSYIHFEENGKDRAGMGYLPDGTFVFYINDPSGQQVQIGLDSDGNAIFRGDVVGGSITSDTTIDVTTDATIGNKLILKNDDVVGGTISVYEGADTAPTLNIRAEGSRPIMISTGTGTTQFQCDASTTYVRGKNELRLGTTDGNDKVYINNKLAATAEDIETAIRNHVQQYHSET
ncbi:MAG: hypothetical protein HFI90_07020 [Clostridia bacterium]|nr:hypothetical protein [Clostridia bacterium]